MHLVVYLPALVAAVSGPSAQAWCSTETLHHRIDILFIDVPEGAVVLVYTLSVQGVVLTQRQARVAGVHAIPVTPHLGDHGPAVITCGNAGARTIATIFCGGQRAAFISSCR